MLGIVNRFPASLFRRSCSSGPLVLGIETSCDDTGASVMRGRTVLSDIVNSQQEVHLRYGGIIPPIAQDLHRENIEQVIQDAMRVSDIDFRDLSAIAVTNRPGLPLSLKIGLRYAKHLCRKHGKPLIPIHHMQAHALTVRISKVVEFPFLCLLISGGHSLLTYAKSVSEFSLLGESMDDAPGELFDKIARDLKLRNLAEFQHLSGGAAIEKAAGMSNNSEKFAYPLPLARYRDCQFSFSGLKNSARRHLIDMERKFGVAADEVIPCYADYSAAVMRAVTRHICHRTQRAIEFCETDADFFPTGSKRTLVISGGVACNNFIYNALNEMTAQFGFEAVRPHSRHCTDNGVMIAWNGVEKFEAGLDLIAETNFQQIKVDKREPLGVSLIDLVKSRHIACKWAKIRSLEE